MTKNLRKAIMECSQLENKYFSNSTVENMNKYKKHKNFCSKLYKKETKKFYSQLHIKNVTGNKLSWKTMKPFLNEKCNFLNSEKPGKFGNIPTKVLKIPLKFAMLSYKTHGIRKYQEN